MVFSSFEFLFRFLPAFLIIYFITPKKFRNAVLFLGSIAFYTYGEAQYVLLLLASVTVNYVIARSMYKTPSIYIKENSASIVPYILKCLFLFPKEDCICSLPEHT